MAKSAAEERRELTAAVSALQQQVGTHANTLDEARTDRDAKAAAFADFRVEAAGWWAKHDALAREFAEYKRLAEVREQRWWQFAAVTLGAILTALFYYLRKQP